MSMSSVAPAVRASLERFRRDLSARFGARLRDVRLFGSYARGEARPDSDVDILVLVDDLTRAERRDIIHLAADLDLDQFVGLAPLAMSTAHFARLRALEAGLAEDIEREGVPL